MKKTLMDYQIEARNELCFHILSILSSPCSKGSTYLSAPTGAGKTVIATSVIESILFGNAENNMPKDDDAVILWFSKEPILNVQTRDRILESSSLISPDRLHIIQTDFNEKELQRGKVYFISNGKLASHSNLVKGHKDQDDSEDTDLFESGFSSGQESGTSFWDVIKNTNDSGARIYLFIDEAHQGMKTPAKSNERNTIIRTLIDGKVEGGAIPIVIGISATIDRFSKGIVEKGNNAGKLNLSGVLVDIADVRKSGLIKDRLVLAGVDNERFSETTLLRLGARKLVLYKNEWELITESTGESPVEPLMILQTPNKVDMKTIQEWVNIIREEIPDMKIENFANVFGEHAALTLPDGSSIEYMEPTDIDHRNRIRVVIAKDSITTGWDCPRAEVLVSFRPTNEITTITQLMGRMVRQPLRRYVKGNDFLNSVYCVLPSFNHENVSTVAKLIKDGSKDSDAIPVESVVIEPTEISLNPVLIEKHGEDKMKKYLDKLASLPTYTKPVKSGSPIMLLNSLIAKLTANYKEMQKDHDDHDSAPRYSEDNEKFIVNYINYLTSKYSDAVRKEKEEILAMHVVHTNISSDGEEIGSTDRSVSKADAKAIDAYFRKADRAMKKCATLWIKHMRKNDSALNIDDLKLTMAALGGVKSAIDDLENECRSRFIKTFRDNKVIIDYSPDDLGNQFDLLMQKSGEVDSGKIGEISSVQIPYHFIENDVLKPLKTYEGHILSDAQGKFPKPRKKNEMEDYVIKKEMGKVGYMHTWYRNPTSENKPSLRIVRENGDNFSYIYPDFIFFGEQNGKVFASIVDPHGSFLSDNKDRLIAMADFAEKHKDEFMQIVSICDDGKGEYRAMNLIEDHVREEIKKSTNPMSMYKDDTYSYDY